MPPPLQPVANRGRLPALDGLRGYAAAAVVLYHGVLGTNPHTLDVLGGSLLAQHGADRVLKLVLSLLNGELAVGLFFAISGTVLFRALAAMDQPGELGRLPIRFLLRRLLRLWPVMAVCLVAHFLVLRAANDASPGFVEHFSARDLLDNLLLVRTPVNGVTWTLAVELAAAPWLLLLYLGVRRWGPLRTVPALAAGILVLRVTGLLYHPPGMLTGLPLILAGALLESLAANRLVPAFCWRLAVPLGAAIALGNELLVPLSAKSHALLLVLGASLLVGGLTNARPDASLLHTGLARFLGRISYSLYLWNMMILVLLLRLAGRIWTEADPIVLGLAVGFVTLLATIPVALLSERWLERPSIHLGRALTRRHPRPVEPALLSQVR